MKKYISSERANLFEPNIYIAMIVKISGSISEAEMEQAVKKAYQANEATMSKIVLDEDGSAWYEKMRDSGCRFSREEDSWENILRKSEKSPFDLKDGELVRTFMTEEGSQTILLIHAHHLAGDGKAMLILINDIVDSLDGVELAYKPMTLIDRQFLEKRAKLMLPIKLAIKNSNRKWRKRGSGLGVTNLNQIDIPANHNNFHIENILFIPPKVSYSKRVIGIASYGELLKICHHNMISF